MSIGTIPCAPCSQRHYNFFIRPLQSIRAGRSPFDKGSPLVCRCFGVYEREVVDYICNHCDTDLATLTGNILAGGGCTHCSGDLKQYIKGYGKGPARPTMMNRAQLVMEIYQLFCDWRSSGEMELDILEFYEETLIVAPLGETAEGDIVSFGQYLQTHSSTNLNHLKISIDR